MIWDFGEKSQKRAKGVHLMDFQAKNSRENREIFQPRIIFTFTVYNPEIADVGACAESEDSWRQAPLTTDRCGFDLLLTVCPCPVLTNMHNSCQSSLLYGTSHTFSKCAFSSY